MGLGILDAAASKLKADGGSLFDNAVNWAAGFSNARPQVNAGADHVAAVWADQAGTIPALTALDGAAYDDRLPDPPATVSCPLVGGVPTCWAMASGPGTVTFTNPAAFATTASFSTPGTYVLTLTVTDGALSNSDDVRIQAYDRNTAPVVSAGSNQNKELGTGSTITLTGTFSDDGLPYPPGTTTVQWSQVSGPGVVTFANAMALSTTATLSSPGIYVLRFTASDGELSSASDMTVTATSTVLLVHLAEQFRNGDLAVEQRIQALGHTVVRITDSAAAAASATGKTLVVISPSCNNNRIYTKFRTVTVPVLTMHIASWDDMNLTAAGTNWYTTATWKDIAIYGTAPFHPITAGLQDTVTVANTAAQLYYGAPANAQSKVASLVGDTAKLVVFAHEKGQAMSGLNAPARRVALGFMDATLASLTGDGGRLVDAAVQWATKSNRSPVVSAGEGIWATVGVPAPLSGLVTDDGFPNPPGAITVTWSVQTAPPGGTVTFTDPHALVTSATFSVPGSYVIALTASDGGAMPVTDTISVSVNGAALVDAGPDVQVTFPDATASLAGTATDASLPDPPGALSFTWSKVSGPGTATFSTPTALATDVMFSAVGIYTLRLTANDGFLSGSDDMTATVRAPAGTSALLVVGPGSSPADATIQARLQALGYAVTVKTDATAAAADAAGKTVVLISGTVDPAVVASTFRDVAVPVVVAQPYLFDDMQLTGSTAGLSCGLAAAETQVRVTSSTHPMAAGLSGTVDVASQTGGLGWGVPNANAVVVVRPMTTGRAAVFGYEAGAAMVGRAAPARRVGLFFQPDAVANLTSAGWALFDASLHWTFGRAAPPTFDPAPGTFTATPQSVSLCCVTADTAIRYTLDGSDPAADPNPAITPYTGPIDVTTTTTIKAIAIRTGFEVSTVAVGKYTVSLGKLATPTISPGSGVKDSTQFPTLVGPPGTEIWYTTDGSEPAPGRGSSTLYVGPMPVGSAATLSVTLKAKAFMTDWTPSDTASAFYDFDPDRDGLSTMRELELGTNPLNPDTNGDGIDDGTEVAMGLSPTDLTNLDMDGDGVPNATEIAQGTDPFKADTDGDGVNDGQDCFPLDLSRACGGDPNDVTPPTIITLTEPLDASLRSTVPPE